ncbi:MAG: PKD domain-containing protein [bacterium]
MRFIKNLSIVLIFCFMFLASVNLAYGANGFIIAIDDSSNIYYAKSNGDGTFSDYARIDYLGGSYARGVTINDFNNDGFMDFIAGRGISSTAYLYLFLNDGNNNFTKSAMIGTISNASSYVMDMTSGDYNNDGNLDFIANTNSTTVGFFLGDGKGNFTKSESSLGNNGRGMDAADFDHDGNLDFVRGRYYGYIEIYWGDGTGAFPSNLYLGDSGSDPYGVVAGDFNNDGNDDIVANEGSGGAALLWTGNGDRTFTYVGTIASLDFNNHGCYDAYDFNADGNLDIVAVNYSGRRVYYFPGNGDGTFGTATEIGSTSSNSLGLSAEPIGPPAGVPVADISPAIQTIGVGDTANLDGLGSYDPDDYLDSWIWNFGDGNTATGAGTSVGTINHTYASEGTYFPNLMVMDNEGKSDYDTAVVHVEGDAPWIDTNTVVFEEAQADGGIWDLTLNGSSYAFDTEGIVSYEWDISQILIEDFEDANADRWHVIAGTWAVTDTDIIDGNYSYWQSDAGLDRTWTLFEEKYDNVTIEADVKLVSGAGEEAQVIFRAENSDNHYEYILRGRGNNDVLLYRYTNGSASNIYEFDLPSTFPSYPVTNGSTYHIKIVCEGTLMEFYLDGILLFAFHDSSFSIGHIGFSTYRTEAIFDNLVVSRSATGETLQHKFKQGTYNVDLSVSDAAGTEASGSIPMIMQAGDPPVADAGGPYSADESHAFEGGWTFSLDGSGSSDDVEIRKHVWNFGVDPFDGTEFKSGKWFTNGGISQDDEVSLTGVSTWDTRYMVTKATFPKVVGQVFQTRIKTPGSGRCMFGFKNTSTTNFHYNQFPYEFYLSNGSIYIYENSNSRGDTGFNYAYNTWYDFRIELKEAGAVYSYRPSGTELWYEVYNSGYTTSDTSLRKGITVYDGTFTMDDFLETTAGVNPDFTLYFGTGAFSVDLTVYDRAGQSDTDNILVNLTSGDVPIAYAGPDQNLDETAASDGNWAVGFDASASTDDYGIYTYEWDWDYDPMAGFNPSGDTGATASHSWSAPGTYIVAVRVTDHALQSSVDTMTVAITTGDPPTADAGGPYVVDEFSGNAFAGGWTVSLDGTGSSDPESNIGKYIWNLGTDTFDGTVVNDNKWALSGSGVTQNNEVSITGDGTWGNRYFCSKDTYNRVEGMAFEAKIEQTGSGYAMIGFKNNSDSGFHYNQWTYAIYFYNGNIYIYEDGSSRGDTGSDYSFNTWYEIRIELKETQGARYYYRAAGSPEWILLYDSSHSTSASFKRGITVSSGTCIIDDIKEIAVGPSPSYRLYGLGMHTISLTVYDQANQTDSDSTTVTTLANNPPVADIAPDGVLDESYNFNGQWSVKFDASGSFDDHGIYKYEWDWDHNISVGFNPSGDEGKRIMHVFPGAGTYIVALRVTDHVLQSAIDTATITLTVGSAPVADAGGPYTAGAGGPPAYFNGSGSSDDIGIAKYLWDADDTVDSDGDGNFTNDMDAVGRKPFYTYSAAGTYTVTLTVVDCVGQTGTDTSTVNVADNLAPDVICVPWVAGNPLSPHDTYNGRSIRLKAIVRDAGDLTYQWNFGDGSPPSPNPPAAVTDKYAIEVSHTYPVSPDGTPFTATLTVWDSAGLSGTDNYYVMVRPQNLDSRTNIAIDEGLWWLHKSQNKADGKWTSYSSYYTSPTASAIQAFEINGHLQDGDNQENPYVETVNKGFDYMFTGITASGIGAQAHGNPDTNFNGIGIGVNSNRPIYEGGMVMDAIASSNNPRGFATTGGANINGRFFYEILTDMVDMYAWGQVDSGSARGGWRYSWNSAADNSACQWAAIGMIAAEDNFGILIPQWVKDENDIWLNYSYNGTGFGYTGAGNGVATTPSGMVQLAFGDKTTDDPRWRTAEDYIANHWYWQNNNYYGAYALVKSLRLAQPTAVVNLSATGLDWYNDPATGVRKRIVDQQNTSGYWNVTYGSGFSTSWAIIMLTPTLFVQPPVADAGDDIIWAYDMELTFDASGSFHMDPTRSIVLYEWDFDGDGTWDYVTTDPSDPNARYTYPDPDPNTSGDPPQIYTVRLRVTDDNDPAQTDIDTREVTVAEPPHAPYAEHGGPYTATAGIPLTLDGSGSYDIDPGDGISTYQWDLDNDGVWFDDVDLDTTDATAEWTFASPGSYAIGLKVWDNGAFNPISCTIGVDCIPMESIPEFTIVTVFENLAPVADADGPYFVNEGTPLQLDGSGSYEPNGDTMYFAWDLDEDGNYDDSISATPTYTWMDNGTYTVGLKVSDSLLEDTDTSTVTVNDLKPSAGFTWQPEPQAEGSAVIFSDTSTSYPDTIVGWSWDFAGLGTSSTKNPSFTFNDNGTYKVTLTVTDDDGSMDSVSHNVTITDNAPAAHLSGDTTLDEGQAGNYDASGSASYPDGIIGYEWDWDYDGVTFNPSGDTGAIQSHSWMDDGTYTVAVRVTDDDGSMDIATLVVSVNDLAPTAALTGDTLLDEGQAGSYDASGSTSPADSIVSYEWDWDYDGVTFNPSGDTGALQTHTWTVPDMYTVAVRVTDDDGSTDIATLTVAVSSVNKPPVLQGIGPQSMNEGESLSIPLSATDPDPGDTLTFSATGLPGFCSLIDNGDGTGSMECNPTYSDSGIYPITVIVTDDGVPNLSDTESFTLTVNDISQQIQTIFDLSARPKSGKVQLTWSPVAGAMCYNIYRSQTSGGPYSLIASCQVTDYCTYLDYNVVNGITYYYVVTSLSGGIESLYSNEASATPSARTR